MASTIWKGHLTFGLVSLPVRLQRAARKERVRMHYLAPAGRSPEDVDEPMGADEGSSRRPGPRLATTREEEAVAAQTPTGPLARISQMAVSRDDRRPLENSELLRGHEVAPDQYVTFTQQEMRAMRPETSTTMEIVRSVRLAEIDPVYFDTSYYVVPDEGGARAYALLFTALKESEYVALATLTMHGREHVVVIRAGARGLLAHTMFRANEVRADAEFATRVEEVAPKELQLAKSFVEAMAAPFAPGEFKDSQRERLEAAIAKKMAESEVTAAAPAMRAPAPVLDIMEALKKSIEARAEAVKGTKDTKGTKETQDTKVARRGPAKATETKARTRTKRA